jgi:anti-sigma regulatory factor (Ser/Thr protein kinase)
MKAGVPRGHVGNVHEAGFYGSDAEFRVLLMPFVEEGIAAGEPVIIGYDDRKNALLRSWLTDPSAVMFITEKSLYASPSRAIATYRRLFEFYAEMGAEQIRITGEVPHPGSGGRYDGWDRYEAAVNTVWEDFPVWSLCLYDTATAPALVLDAAERTHPRIVSVTGQRRASERYQDLSVFESLPFPADPLEATAPMVELVGSSPAETRHTLLDIGRGRLPDATLDDLRIGVTEAVKNARLHGRPPATVRIWATPDRIVVNVHDRGRGPVDPLAGLVPPSSTARRAGLGLWLMHQLDIDVALMHADDGFTVRLRGGMAMG